jgi:hypothetical protein
MSSMAGALAVPPFYQMPRQMLHGPGQALYDPSLVVPPPPPPPMTSPSDQYRPASHRLNANAKAWQPSGDQTTMDTSASNGILPVAPPPPPAEAPTAGVMASIPNSFRSQFEVMLDSVKQALSSCAPVTGVDISEDSWGRGMTITAWMKCEENGNHGRRARDRNEANFQEIVKLGKKALLASAEKSESAYVQGYKKEPFGFSDNGFSAVLAGMFDSNKACWDMFSKGFCRREFDCRWQHPACHLPIQLEVRPARD